MRREGEIKSDKMTEAFLNKHTDSFWREARIIRPKKVYYPNKVDNTTGVTEITYMFAHQFDKLYNCVSYNVEDITNVFKHDIENAVGSKCMCNCVHGNHSITFTDCYDAIKKHCYQLLYIICKTLHIFSKT